MKPWYEALFEHYSNTYEREVFTQGTLGECDFIEAEAAYNKSLQILDIGCGTGRHSIELARRGYEVSGIDLSEDMLAKARERAASAGLTIPFLRHDARQLPFEAAFDLAIMICEGAFPLMETDEMNYQILQSASRALRSPGKLIFTTLNGLFPLFHSVDDFHASTGEPGNATYHNSSFDLMTFRDHNITRLVNDRGEDLELSCNERYYIPPEITWLLKSVGFSKVDIFGAHLGDFSRLHDLKHTDFEMLVIAEK